MGTFAYIARTPDGQRAEGVVTAETESAALRQLDERNLFPVRVAPQAAPGRSLGGSRIPARRVGMVYGQMADLLKSGVSLLRALSVLSGISGTPALNQLLAEVRDDVAEGQSLADAMAARPRAFSEVHCAMVRAGERGGFLEDVLQSLSEFVERQDELRARVTGALAYPAFIAALGAFGVPMLLVFLVPRYKPLLANFQPPALTQLIFSLSDGLRQYGLLLVVLGCALGVVAWSLIRSEGGRQWWDRARRRLPVFGPVVTLVGVTRFCRVLGTMLNNGVPILQALEIARGAAGSVLLAGAIDDAAENVRAGQPLSEPLRDSRLFPAEVVEMIAVAEEANRLDEVLVEVADRIERRTSRRIDQAVSLIAPMVLVLIAAAVGFVAVGLLAPILSVSEALAQ